MNIYYNLLLGLIHEDDKNLMILLILLDNIVKNMLRLLGYSIWDFAIGSFVFLIIIYTLIYFIFLI